MLCCSIDPVSITRFPSFRTQTLESLSVDSVQNGFLSNPDPGENLVSGNLVMETGWKSRRGPWKTGGRNGRIRDGSAFAETARTFGFSEFTHKFL